MRLLAIAAALLSFAAADSWSPAVDLLRKSTVIIETKGSGCTGFVINEEKDYVLTAAHCDGEELYADSSPTKVVAKDQKKDLLVLHVEGIDRPALHLAADDPKVGDVVGSYGFGYAWERPMFRVAHISDDETYIHENGIGGPFFLIDAAFVGGQSGGPVVNAAGEVVMIVQRASDRVGIGIGAKTIKQKVGKYFEKRP